MSGNRLVGIISVSCLLLIVVGMTLFNGFTQIDTGNIGVVSRFGQVEKKVLTPDIYFTLFKKVTEVCAKELPLSIDNMKPQTQDKITLSDLDVDVYYQTSPEESATLMTKWASDITKLNGENCSRLGANYLLRQVRETVYSVITEYNSATIHTERAAISGKIVKQLQESLDQSVGKNVFFIRSVNVRNLVTDKALEANIKAAAQAQFKLQEEKNRLEVARVEAERKREEARGAADAMRIKAEAISKQGGAEYVQLQAIEKWDGKLPVTNAGNTVPFLNVK